jgi:hypothetical protein
MHRRPPSPCPTVLCDTQTRPQWIKLKTHNYPIQQTCYSDRIRAPDRRVPATKCVNQTFPTQAPLRTPRLFLWEQALFMKQSVHTPLVGGEKMLQI